jgi:hypothetical protein
MMPLSRIPARLRAGAVLLAAGLVLTGCGGSSSPKAGASPTASTSASTSSSPSSASTAKGKAQVVKVTKYGISFEVPKGWITLNAKKVLKGGGSGKNPFLDEIAGRLGMTRDQLVQAFSTLVQTMSVSDEGANHGLLDNVNSVGQDTDVNDDQLKLQLATVGAKAEEFEHATTDAGAVTRAAYQLSSKAGLTVHGVAIAVHTSTATVLITVSSSSAKNAEQLADHVQASLEKIPGTGPNL